MSTNEQCDATAHKVYINGLKSHGPPVQVHIEKNTDTGGEVMTIKHADGVRTRLWIQDGEFVDAAIAMTDERRRAILAAAGIPPEDMDKFLI